MAWYAAHIVMYIHLKKRKQEHYPIWENVYLIRANSDDEAFKKASRIGQMGEGDSKGTFKWDDEPAEWVFAGVRKLIECRSSAEQLISNPSDDRPDDGTEITYSQFTIEKRDLSFLVEGDPVKVVYEE